MLPNYEDKKASIQKEILGIGKQILDANKIAEEAIIKRDFTLFEKARVKLKLVSKKATAIDNEIVVALALFSPEAKELRSLISYLKITNELVRASANTKNFVKLLANHLDKEMDLDAVFQHTIPLHKSAMKALETSLTMLHMSDEKEIAETFTKVAIEDSKTDDLYEILEKNIFQLSYNKMELSHDYFHVLSAVRRLEKMGDRSTSVANLLLFASIGGEIK